jgi:hypothetical protein
MDERDEQSSKHRTGRCFTNLGISNDWRLVHPIKQHLSIDSI